MGQRIAGMVLALLEFVCAAISASGWLVDNEWVRVPLTYFFACGGLLFLIVAAVCIKPEQAAHRGEDAQANREKASSAVRS